MDVMGHDHPRVQLVVPDFRPVLDGSRDELRHGRLSEKGGAAASVIEPAVHRDEGFAGSRIRGRKGALCRKTVIQAEGDEQRLADDIEMREPASSQVHVWIVRPALRDSPGFGSRLRGRRRPRACPTNVETPGTGPPGPVEGFVEGTVSHNEHRPSLQFRS